jgi:hypothetical protein
MLAYPFYVIEVASYDSRLHAVQNRLSISTAYILGLLHELRAQASDNDEGQEPIMVFGAIAIGDQYEIWVTWETTPSDAEALEAVSHSDFHVHPSSLLNVL